MQPHQFRQWFASLPDKYQKQAKALYDDARRGGGVHTASSLDLIRALIEDQISFDGAYTYDDHQ
ncbi:TPA: hypothetical protein NBJ46_002775 [Enterobacter hormaechei]|uniref:hypothetical protein n=1 Tax=Enterobacter cloacae complex TaxID=354276 RepID=UPI00073578D7|nr:hypothetical protein [Enterobacter hormaechei]KYJ79406.1 hypothetical protein AT292_08225 [Enterobacter cloacae]KTG83041.1 hypothetical protein ASV36_07055 [Enterobacter hormaechei subsp. steigerwaltii]KVJ94840.1 hypothetical protein AWS22_04365 [Enterobacter hormaechei subsp. steigerwaltii]KVJ95487.1 hypothetical protein AWS21_07225 [Enterobacter hormaechei subsp. steigerwaltii]HCD2233257.1 hypothetical protein [Enterobacter hormaechei]